MSKNKHSSTIDRAMTTKWDETNTPTDILFSLPFGEKGHPLFRTQAELIREIQAEPNSEFSERPEDSLRSYLSQVLKPSSDPRSRPISNNFESAILSAIKPRLSEDTDFKKFSKYLQNSFSLLKTASRDVESFGKAFEILEKESEKAKHLVIFTSQPAECVQSSEYARRLRRDLVERLCLNDDSLSAENFKQKVSTRYEFYVDSKQTAKELWLTLYNFLLEEKKVGDLALNNLSLVNTLPSRFQPALKISYTNPGYCCFPTLILNVNNPEPYPMGFHLYYERNKVSVAKISRSSLDWWIRNVYKPLSVMSDEVHSLSWKDVESLFQLSQ